MNKAKYYALLEEYKNLISQKQFNELLCDEQRLQEVKDLLLRGVRRFISAMVIERERYRIKEKDWLPETRIKHERLVVLFRKIQQEEPVDELDYEGTYYAEEFLFGLTLPQFLFVFPLAIIAAFVIHHIWG